MSEKILLHRGLLGVYLDHTKTTFIDGSKGILEYAGYAIDDLARNSTFEEVCYLLTHGELPNKAELEKISALLCENREIPSEIYDILKICKHAHPMDALRTAVSALASFDKSNSENSVEYVYEKGMRLTSQVSTIIMAHHRISKDLDPIKPSKTLGHVANFLYMFDGEKPQKETERLLNTDFIVHADHGLNASAFVSRTVSSTKASFHASITAAIGALSGPLHGGAAENVIQMTQEIGSPENAEEYVKNLLDQGKRVMGFGHRVYKTLDPRAIYIEEGLIELAKRKNKTLWYDILLAVRKTMKPYAKRGINPNVDYFAGIVYHLLGLPQELFVPIFAAGRMPGWTSQILEQLENNILIRPLLEYVGEKGKTYTKLSERT